MTLSPDSREIGYTGRQTRHPSETHRRCGTCGMGEGEPLIDFDLAMPTVFAQQEAAAHGLMIT